MVNYFMSLIFTNLMLLAWCQPWEKLVICWQALKWVQCTSLFVDCWPILLELGRELGHQVDQGVGQVGNVGWRRVKLGKVAVIYVKTFWAGGDVEWFTLGGDSVQVHQVSVESAISRWRVPQGHGQNFQALCFFIVLFGKERAKLGLRCSLNMLWFFEIGLVRRIDVSFGDWVQVADWSAWNSLESELYWTTYHWVRSWHRRYQAIW